MNQAAALVRINDNRIRDKYLLTYLNSDKAQLMYDSMKSDTGRANLSLKDISELSILLPSIEEQLIFEKVVAQIDKSKLLSGCRLFHSWAPENRDKPKHVGGVPRRKTKALRGGRRQHAHLHHEKRMLTLYSRRESEESLFPPSESAS